METTDSLTAFFYNVVPGVMFVLGIISIFTDIIKLISDNKDIVVFGIFMLLILGQFFGFCFQGLTKIIRSYGLNYQIWQGVVENNRASFNKVLEIFEKPQILEKSTTTKKRVEYKYIKKYFENLFEVKSGEKMNKAKLKSIFYLMDNYLHAEGKAWMPLYYTARLAFWSNIFFGLLLWLLFYCLQYIYRYFYNPTDIIREPLEWKLGISLIFIIYSGYLFKEYLIARYDVVIKSFVTTIKINKESKEIDKR